MKLWKKLPPHCAVIFFTISGCSSESVRPYVEEFSGAVSSASAKTERKFNDIQLDAQLDDLRRSRLAAQQAQYILDGCTPLEPTVVDFDQEPTEFDAHCQLSAKTFDPVSQQIKDATVTLPEGDPRVEARNARFLVRGLKDYASALEDLTAANNRSETAAAAASALDAVGGFFEEGRGRGNAPRLFNRSGQSLVSRITDEALETYRYRLLKNIVTQADPSVQLATRTIAAWISQTADNAKVEAAYDTLERTVDAAQLGSPQDLERIERAYDVAKTTEETASWRVYWEIGATHRAIRDSFKKPADFDRLTDANDRILTLAETVKEFEASN